LQNTAAEKETWCQSPTGKKGGENMVLELDGKETELLKHALESFDNELRTLIGRTDKKEARAELHSDEAVARKLLETVSKGARPVGDLDRSFSLRNKNPLK